jgi:hypothetical protein
MKEIDSIFEALAKNLNSDDDDGLWRLIVSTIMEEFARQIMVKSRNGKKCYLRVGACSHWIRPHQSRWTAAGGFAWPAGYKGAEGHSLVRGLPEFDWSEAFQFELAVGCILQNLRARDRSFSALQFRQGQPGTCKQPYTRYGRTVMNKSCMAFARQRDNGSVQQLLTRKKMAESFRPEIQ